MRYFAVVPKEVASHYGSNFRSKPIGTGPFYFKRWDENIKLVMLKNPNYFEYDEQGERLPYLDAVSVRFIPDIQSEFMLFLQGKFDFINSLDASYKDELLPPDVLKNQLPNLDIQDFFLKGSADIILFFF